MEKLKKGLFYTMLFMLGICSGVFINMIFNGYNINKDGAPWMSAMVSSLATIGALVISMGNDEKDRKVEVKKDKKEIEKYRDLVMKKKSKIVNLEFAVLSIVNLIEQNEFNDNEAASIILENKNKLLDISDILYLRDPNNVLALNSLVYDAETKKTLDVSRVADEMDKTVTNLQLELKRWEKLSV